MDGNLKTHVQDTLDNYSKYCEVKINNHGFLVREIS